MQCSKCNRSFVSLKGLRRHQTSSACEKAQQVTMFQCEYCLKYFSYRSGLSRHKNAFCKKAKEYNEIKATVSVGKRKKISIKAKTKVNKSKEKVSDCEDSEDSDDDSNNITITNATANLNLLSGLTKSLKSLKSSPVSKLVIKPRAKIFSDIGTIADDILELLTIKLGDIPAIEILLTNFMSKNYIKIINAAYLSGKSSDNYPMACAGKNHFRYINDKYMLVDDIDGEKLVKTIINNIQNAALIASNKLIRKYMGENKVGDLFEVYDLGQIQKGVCDMFTEISKIQIKKLIAKRVLNPNHQFFSSTTDFYSLQQYYYDKFSSGSSSKGIK